MNKLIRTGIAVLLGSSLLTSGAVTAHHSFQMFDRTYLKLIEGRVTDWHFNNPHSWLYVEALDENGEMQTWSFEGASPVHGVRQGVNGSTYLKGEVVKIVMSPMKDGRPAGAMCFVVKNESEITFPGDASCTATVAAQTWEQNGWIENGVHLDTHDNR